MGSQQTEFRFRVVRVTPEMAAAWLADKAHNRLINEPTVERYMREMRRGWKRNGDTIRFRRSDGRLCDGQHRLTAQVRLRLTIEWLIVEGIEDDAMDTIDVGPGRSPGDVETISYRTADARFKIGLINAIRAGAFRVRYRISSRERHDAIVALGSAPDWARDTLKRRTILGAALMQGAMCLAYLRDPERVDEFAHRVNDGEGLRSNEPALALRQFFALTRDATAAGHRRETFLKVLQAARAHLLGRTLKKLQPEESALQFFLRPDLTAALWPEHKGTA